MPEEQHCGQPASCVETLCRSECQYYVHLANSLRILVLHMEVTQWTGVMDDVDNIILHQPRCADCLANLGHIFEVLYNLLQ